jgi:hypothetical protein
MLAEWTVECAADDPVLVVPWTYAGDGVLPPDGAGAAFVDLRENPYDLDHLPEAEAHPPLMQALRALNATRSPVFTAKCDAWTMDGEELAATREALELAAPESPCGFAGYIDLVWRERTLFASFHLHEQLLHRFVRHADALDHPHALAECVLRPALIDLTGAQEGFAISLYVKALGADAASAYEHWSQTLEGVVALIRGKDLAQTRL